MIEPICEQISKTQDVEKQKTKLNAVDFYVIHETLYHSLYVLNPNMKFTKETREMVMNKVIDILGTMEIEND